MSASTTSRLELPFLQAGQALKNITHNEALNRLDSGLYLSCSDMSASVLPSDMPEGTALIISEMAGSDLSERIGQIGVYLATGWVWFLPKAGWTVWDQTTQTLRVFDGLDWVGPAPENIPDTLPQLGLNSTASPIQRFSIASQTSLFNHDGDSHRLTLNRAAEEDTASLVFQTDFAGAAELGLTGPSGFSLKTSSDGLTFSDRLTTPAGFTGIYSPAFASLKVTLANDTAMMVATPATGGLVALTVVSDAGYPSAARSALFAYDTGHSPDLVSLAVTNRVENHGATVLTGTTSAESHIGVSAVSGGLYLENRVTGDRDIRLTFLC